ncbi:hypothetical protein [Marinobacter sp. RI1]|uniref:hypothetical protein n=1 Tax=Marinobacter sp. RI1 TaxID=3158171 RepID=UPI0034E8D85E
MKKLSAFLISMGRVQRSSVPFVLIGLSLVSSSVLAAPTVSGIEFGAQNELQSGQTLKIIGSGFGAKTQSAPILYDHTDITWENGVENKYQSTFQDMALVKRIDSDPNTIWTKPSLPEEHSTGMLVTKTRETRDGNPGSHYYGRGNVNFLGWPRASGGEKTNFQSSQMYSAFWIKLPYNLSNYYAIPAESNPTSFLTGGPEKYGESFKIEGLESQGRVLAFEKVGALPNGWLFIEPPAGVSVKELVGKRLVGIESGAEVTFPESASLAKFDQYGFLTPRGKYARFWSNPDGTGYRFSLANLGLSGTGENIWSSSFGGLYPIPGKWNLFEIQIDTGASPNVTAWLNGEVYLSSEQSWREAFTSSSISDSAGLTIALLGIDDFMPVPFSVEVDDIYLDKTSQRIMLCNRPDIVSLRTKGGHCELQRPVSWSDRSIEVELVMGSLDVSKPLYFYIFDRDGVSNSKGLEWCNNSDCSYPPAAINLQVN